ncbi:MAG: hypothetical protein U5N55_04735, partial [Cypionkella sp.]|nr:hypothetical protein [Cypionkella sp.]
LRIAPYGLRAADIQTGETLCCTSGGPVTVVTRRETQMAVSIRIAPQALGNRRELRVAGGQGVLIESAYAARITGSGRVVVPALALRQWRGISVSSARADGLCFTLSRPALVLGASGVLIAMDGPANGPLSTANLPPVPSLSLPSAQQLIACLIAYEAGALLRPQAAAF